VLNDRVRQFLIAVFSDCGASYRDPTKESILEATDKCKISTEDRMDTPGKEIIKHISRNNETCG
jgi:hypothetical protein